MRPARPMSDAPDLSAVIEAAAQADAAFWMDNAGDPTWSNLPTESQNDYRDEMRVVLSAALPSIAEMFATAIEAEMADVMDQDGDAVTAVSIVRGLVLVDSSDREQFPCGASMPCVEHANIYGEGNTGPDLSDRLIALTDEWEAEIDEQTKAQEFGIAEGLRVALDAVTALLRSQP